MAVVVICDGCACPGTTDSLKEVGRLDPCVYCPECEKAWEAFVAAEAAEKQRHAREFETWRRDTLAALRKAGLQRLPDEVN